MSNSLPITDTADIREQLERIFASNSFRRRRKLLPLLEYLATETREGRASGLTQKKIASEVFGLGESFDPTLDGTVRIAAGRLRTALLDYYRQEAGPEEIRIHVPPRHYYVSTEAQRTPKAEPNSPTSGYSLAQPAAKKISQNDIVGQMGINLIERTCLEMGFLWHATGLEAGIDGYIEIRLETGEVTNCIIQVQSKATDRPFEGENESSVEFRCSAKDLHYWLSGNAPVILIRSRPKTSEAYWVSLKDYFSDLTRRKSGRIVFDRLRNRFDVAAKSALQKLAGSQDSGLYLGTNPKNEVLHSNLLALASFPRYYYVAETAYRTPEEVFAALRDFSRAVPGEWILGDKMITSFHDLSTHPWREVCERGTVEQLNTADWAQTNDPARERHFVRLLNACLRNKLFRKGIKFSKENQYYYFRATENLLSREYAYQSREHRTSRFVFKGYPKKSDHTQMSYFRHSAFEGRFVRFGGNWYLQITPSYHFTRDGMRISKYAPGLMSGIKRLETNQAVHGQIVMWAHLLTERSLFDNNAGFIDFGSLVGFDLDVGLDDDAWLKHEDPDKLAALDPGAEEDRQKSLTL